MRWPVILFDLDGTLVNTIDLIVASFQHTFKECLKIEKTPEEIKETIGRTLVDVFTEYAPDRVDELVSHYIDFNLAQLENLQRNYEGVPEALAGLKSYGATMGVVTAKRRGSAQRSLQAAQLDDIELLVAMEDTPRHKPDPQPLLCALQKLGVSPDQAIYVGDAIFDVQAAKAAGMDVIAVTWGAGKAAELASQNPTHLIDHPSALIEILTCA